MIGKMLGKVFEVKTKKIMAQAMNEKKVQGALSRYKEGLEDFRARMKKLGVSSPEDLIAAVNRDPNIPNIEDPRDAHDRIRRELGHDPPKDEYISWGLRKSRAEKMASEGDSYAIKALETYNKSQFEKKGIRWKPVKSEGSGKKPSRELKERVALYKKLRRKNETISEFELRISDNKKPTKESKAKIEKQEIRSESVARTIFKPKTSTTKKRSSSAAKSVETSGNSRNKPVAKSRSVKSTAKSTTPTKKQRKVQPKKTVKSPRSEPTKPKTAVKKATAIPASYISEIRELASLRDDGIITDEEFETKKINLLKQ